MKPLSYKLYFEEDDEDLDFNDKYWDTGLGAAGCIFIAKDTGRILIAHRSGKVDFEPHTWGTWGGKIDEGETPLSAVVREVEEETGYNGRYKVQPLGTFVDPEFRFKYNNYLILIPFEFTPKLNWENDDSKWVEWGEWPHPLHFGLRALLKNSAPVLMRIIKLLKRKKAGIIEDVNVLPPSPAIVQKAETNAPVSMDITNAYIVATTLWGEARGEGTNGMQAVMNVIMNRANGNFDKASMIVLKPKQFSMWNSVTNPIQTALDVADKHRKDASWIDAVRLVDLASNGKLPDITGGALFYFNPKKANPSWAKKMIKTVTVGNHDFYKLPPPKKTPVKKKVPTAITEMIENQNPHNVVIFKLGIVGDDVFEYEMRSPFSFLRYRFSPRQKLFYFDMIGTPQAKNQGKGHATAIMETFFKLVKQYNATLDCDTYTTSGMEKIKPAIEKMAKQFGVRIVKGQRNEDGIDKFSESNTIREDSDTPRYGDPGHHVVWGGLWSTGRIIAHIVKDRQDPEWGHSRDMGPRRFVYFQEIKTLFWNNVPDKEDKEEVTKWLNHYGYEVERHMADADKWAVLAGLYRKRGKKQLNEGERLDYLNNKILELETEWERLDSQGSGFEKQQSIQKQLINLRMEKENWEKMYHAANVPITENKLLMENRATPKQLVEI